MRITCPNCGAQYEVDDALIPEAGRDVQCSNCGKGWFQARLSDAEADEAPETTPAEDSIEVAPEPEAEAHGTVETGHDSEPADEAEPVTASDIETDVEAEETAEMTEGPVAEAEAVAEDEDDRADGHLAEASESEREPEAATEAPEDMEEPGAADEAEDEEAGERSADLAAHGAPRKPEEAVLAVLREEAEREIAQRRQETEGLETQPDLGLSEPPERRTGPSPADIAAGAAVASAARRDLLPDIDEINSTLRPDTERAMAEREEAEEGVAVERRRGFRMGFGLMILLAAALIGLYIASGWLAAEVPALEPFLIAYVDAANGLRAWIDGLLAAGVDGLSG